MAVNKRAYSTGNYLIIDHNDGNVFRFPMGHSLYDEAGGSFLIHRMNRTDYKTQIDFEDAANWYQEDDATAYSLEELRSFLELSTGGFSTALGGSSATTGDVLTWDGSSWGPAALPATSSLATDDQLINVAGPRIIFLGGDASSDLLQVKDKSATKIVLQVGATGDVLIGRKLVLNSIIGSTGGALDVHAGNANDYVQEWYNSAGTRMMHIRTASDGSQLQMLNSSGSVGLTISGQSGNVLTFAEGKNISFGTVTGTKIGQASDKLAFYGVTPIAQPAHIADPAAVVAMTQDDLTDSSGGTANTVIAAITNAANAGSADVGPVADGFADIAAQLAKIKTDIAAVKAGADANNAAIDAINAVFASLGITAAA